MPDPNDVISTPLGTTMRIHNPPLPVIEVPPDCEHTIEIDAEGHQKPTSHDWHVQDREIGAVTIGDRSWLFRLAYCQRCGTIRYVPCDGLGRDTGEP